MVHVTFTLKCDLRSVDLDVSVPKMEEYVYFCVKFPEGSHIEECSHHPVDLPCVLEFSSSEPISCMEYITFTERSTRKRYMYCKMHTVCLMHECMCRCRCTCTCSRFTILLFFITCMLEFNICYTSTVSCISLFRSVYYSINPDLYMYKCPAIL